MKTLEGPEPQIIQVRKIKPTLDHSIQKQLSLSLSLACQEIGGDDIDTLGNDDRDDWSYGKCLWSPTTDKSRKKNI